MSGRSGRVSLYKQLSRQSFETNLHSRGSGSSKGSSTPQHNACSWRNCTEHLLQSLKERLDQVGRPSFSRIFILCSNTDMTDNAAGQDIWRLQDNKPTSEDLKGNSYASTPRQVQYPPLVCAQYKNTGEEYIHSRKRKYLSPYESFKSSAAHCRVGTITLQHLAQGICD